MLFLFVVDLFCLSLADVVAAAVVVVGIRLFLCFSVADVIFGSDLLPLRFLLFSSLPLPFFFFFFYCFFFFVLVLLNYFRLPLLHLQRSSRLTFQFDSSEAGFLVSMFSAIHFRN